MACDWSMGGRVLSQGAQQRRQSGLWEAASDCRQAAPVVSPAIPPYYHATRPISPISKLAPRVFRGRPTASSEPPLDSAQALLQFGKPSEASVVTGLGLFGQTPDAGGLFAKIGSGCGAARTRSLRVIVHVLAPPVRPTCLASPALRCRMECRRLPSFAVGCSSLDPWSMATRGNLTRSSTKRQRRFFRLRRAARLASAWALPRLSRARSGSPLHPQHRRESAPTC